jgi:hypothetical protein
LQVGLVLVEGAQLVEIELAGRQEQGVGHVSILGAKSVTVVGSCIYRYSNRCAMARQGPWLCDSFGCGLLLKAVNVTAGGISSPMVVGKPRMGG